MKTPGMKSGTALFLQIVVVLVGLAAFAFLLGEPHLEGRNAHATIFEIYFHDPFLAYVYVGSLPFFLGLQRAFVLLGDVRRRGTFSTTTVNSLRTIHRCALVVLGFVAGGVVFILVAGDGEDRPAGIFMSALVALPAIAISAAATMAVRHLQRTAVNR
ncbi:MAG TPA: DUF2975 domain-containing protein [Acidobacteriota bacterium]|nr:DUF2975 domain-containing protein [Acidobacteriota bacterium]